MNQTAAPPGVTRMPGAVDAASVVTLVFTLGTLAYLILFGVILGPAIAAIMDTFGGSLPAIGLATAAGLVLLTGAAAACAALIRRRNRIARRVLLALSVLTVPIGLFLWWYVVPAVIALAALAVIVLLCTGPSRRWFANEVVHGSPSHS